MAQYGVCLTKYKDIHNLLHNTSGRSPVQGVLPNCLK